MTIVMQKTILQSSTGTTFWQTNFVTKMNIMNKFDFDNEFKSVTLPFSIFVRPTLYTRVSCQLEGIC